MSENPTEKRPPTVGMYERPNRPAVSPLMLVLIVALLAISALSIYFFFFR